MDLIDKLFLKRFCLPIDTNIESYERGIETVNPCLCSHYNHISCIFQKKVRILSYGINKMGDSSGIMPGIHAEHDAIKKLCPIKRKKRLKNVNLLVIRLSSKNKLQISKPCNNCIEMMKTLPNKLGYNIQHIFYSDANGNIVKTNLQTLDNEEKHYTRFYKRKLTNMCDN